MRGVVIVGNAPWRWRPEFVALLRAAELVLAADGGANHLARIGMRPAAVVGDLDSIRPEVRRWIGEERIVPRPDQEFTDLHKTIAYAFDERGAERVTILAATGGRLDHALENLALLGRWASRGAIELREEGQRIVAVASTFTADAAAGTTVSLLPLGHCPRVWTRGLRWALAGEPLDLLGRTSMSNAAEGGPLEVRVEGGVVLAFLPSAGPDW